MGVSCALALILAIDVSGSVTPERYDLQMQGFGRAFQDLKVQSAILGQEGGVAIEVIQWWSQQQIVLPWRILRTPHDIESISKDVSYAERADRGTTALGLAEDFAIEQMKSVPCDAERRVIDVSGDGCDNVGDRTQTAVGINHCYDIAADHARKLAIENSITINGLPIRGSEDNVVDWYKAHVPTPDGFIVEAADFSDVARAVQLKLQEEISGNYPRQFALRSR